MNTTEPSGPVRLPPLGLRPLRRLPSLPKGVLPDRLFLRDPRATPGGGCSTLSNKAIGSHTLKRSPITFARNNPLKPTG